MNHQDVPVGERVREEVHRALARSVYREADLTVYQVVDLAVYWSVYRAAERPMRDGASWVLEER